MNKVLNGFLAAAMALSAASLQAQTYLAPRPMGMDLALESVTFKELTNQDVDDRFGGNLQVAAFYTKSSNAADLGSYFSPVNRNNFSMVTTAGTATNGVPVPPTTGVDLNEGLIIYDQNTGRTATTNVVFNPSQVTYGLKFFYHQDLSRLLDGLYFRFKLPVVKVINDMGFAASSSTAQNVLDLQQYFAGTLPAIPMGASNARTQLVNAKIDGKKSVTCVADTDLQLGYMLLERERYHLAVNLGLTLPTGNTPKGVYAFEPVAGNGGHIAIGAGYEFAWRIWGDEHTNIKFNSSLDYRYALEAKEVRTFGLTKAAMPQGFGQYSLVTTGTNNSFAGYAVTNPSANSLTIQANVRPGSMVDGTAGFSYNYGGLTLDLGYNLFYKENESVTMAEALPVQNLMVGTTSNLGAQISTKGMYYWGPQTRRLEPNTTIIPLTADLIDLNSIATPSQNSHKAFGQIGYVFKDMAMPVMVSIGGHYEFAGNSSSIENWGVNLKTGISF